MYQIPQTLEHKIRHFIDKAGYKTADDVLRDALKALEEKVTKPAPDSEHLQRRKEAIHMQVIEDNPFTPEDETMFAMFDHKGWSFEQRASYINSMVLSRKSAVSYA